MVLKHSWAVAPSEDSQHIVTLGFCNILAKLLSEGLCSWPPRGAEGPVWETLLGKLRTKTGKLRTKKKRVICRQITLLGKFTLLGTDYPARQVTDKEKTRNLSASYGQKPAFLKIMENHCNGSKTMFPLSWPIRGEISHSRAIATFQIESKKS